MPAPGPLPAKLKGATVFAPLLVGLVAVLVFGHDLSSEPHFADESAFIAQSYYADLWLDGDRDDRAWLEYPAIDLPPLPKYLIGLSLRAGGHRRPGPAAALAWYRDIHTRTASPEVLDAARWPAVLLGAIGCMAVYELGRLARDGRTGLLAAILLMANPLYRLHARRAMADVPAEALVLATAAVGLLAWRGMLARRWGVARWLASATASSVLAGLAVLAKLNGGLGLMTLAAWALLAAALPRFDPKRKGAVLGACAIAGAVSFATFAALDPTLTAQPGGPLPSPIAELARRGIGGRTCAVLEHRLEVSRAQQITFPDDALTTPLDKLKAVAAQGFGRFGPFGPRQSDSRRRFDWGQDWGALVWAPWVVLGMAWAVARGRHQLRAGEPPTAWAVLLQALLALATVTAFIPLAWDRYFLPIQAGSALLAAGLAVATFDALARFPVRGPSPPS